MYDNIISFVARGTDSGKTYIMERVLCELKQRGLTLTAVKHGAHIHMPDAEGKDSHKFAHSGADRVIVFSDHGLFMYTMTPPDIDTLVELAGRGVDLVLVEGFKAGPFAKIEVFNHTRYATPLSLESSDPSYIALVTDQELAGPLPRFRFADIRGLCDFIEERLARRLPVT